jgi:predicted AlkP superfamily pyrophosphatase or phosphodiesterase
MFKRAVFPLLAALLLTACHQPPEPRPKPPNPPLAKHAVIISIDGCRPDVLLRAELQAASNGAHPAIQQLMAEGCFTFWAQTIPASVTLPSHTSMLTGTPAEIHGITWNVEQPESKIEYPHAQTIFEIARRNHLTTAIFASKGKFHTLAQPGTIDWGFINEDDNPKGDPEIAQLAADTIRAYKPNVLFYHFGFTDVVGHRRPDLYEMDERGWGSPAQVAAAIEADSCVATIVKALKDAGIYNDTLIIVTADHGGAGGAHGRNDPRSRHIPWICVGPQVKHNFDLTRYADLTVHTEDTFATACYFLGLETPDNVTGKPITQILQDHELLQPR